MVTHCRKFLTNPIRYVSRQFYMIPFTWYLLHIATNRISCIFTLREINLFHSFFILPTNNLYSYSAFLKDIIGQRTSCFTWPMVQFYFFFSFIVGGRDSKTRKRSLSRLLNWKTAFFCTTAYY